MHLAMDTESPIFKLQLAEWGGTASVATLLAHLSAFVTDESLLAHASEAEKHELKRLFGAASRMLEEPSELVARLGYSPLPLVTARIAQDHGIFKQVVRATRSGDSVSLIMLSEATGLEMSLLEPLLGYLCSQDMICRAGVSRFQATSTTRLLARQLGENSIAFFHDVLLPGFAAMNDRLYKPSPTQTAWQIGHCTQFDFYRWMDLHPGHLDRYHRSMAGQSENLPTWLDDPPFDLALFQGFRTADYAFVDVGGGLGQQCRALKEHLPDFDGRIINEDKPEVLRIAPRILGVEHVRYDYFSTQPVKGAGIYYLRHILRSHSDKSCVQILENQVQAMTADSLIIIDEKVLPDDRSLIDIEASRQVSSLELTLNMTFGTRERRKSDWYALVRFAGLMVKDVRVYTYSYDAVIITALAEGPTIDPSEIFRMSI